jgi:hypothetical protein
MSIPYDSPREDMRSAMQFDAESKHARWKLYVALGHSQIGEVQDWLEKLPVITYEGRATA